MITIALVFILVVVPAIVLHECAHGWAADKLGDPTARKMGRLTLNPLKHIDLFGTVLLPLLLYLPFALGWTKSPIIFGFAKPVPFDPRNLHNPKRDIMLVRLAGPATNIMIAFVFAKILAFVPNSLAHDLLVTAVLLNLGLAIFNMIPVPPLDGSGILYAVLPAKFLPFVARMDNFTGIIVVFVMLNMGWLNFLDSFIYRAANLMGVS